MTPSVSVVIPTIARPSLVPAVRSVLQQSSVADEVLVVADRPLGDIESSPELQDKHVRFLRTTRGSSAARQRMVGVANANGDLVAFLDDDDTWHPDKLAAQCAEYSRLAEAGRRPIISCRVRAVDAESSVTRTEPQRLYPDDSPDLASYMFRRRSLEPIGYVLGSSTLLCAASLLAESGWNEAIPLHEDWEWVIRTSRLPDVAVTILSAPLVDYFIHPLEQSASRVQGGWRRSITFADDVGLRGRTRGDFLLAVPARTAILDGDRVAAMRIAARVMRDGRPGWRACVLFVVQICFPHALLSRVWAKRELWFRSRSWRAGLPRPGRRKRI